MSLQTRPDDTHCGSTDALAYSSSNQLHTYVRPAEPAGRERERDQSPYIALVQRIDPIPFGTEEMPFIYITHFLSCTRASRDMRRHYLLADWLARSSPAEAEWCRSAGRHMRRFAYHRSIITRGHINNLAAKQMRWRAGGGGGIPPPLSSRVLGRLIDHDAMPGELCRGERLVSRFSSSSILLQCAQSHMYGYILYVHINNQPTNN